jgi:hypothetical protein
MLNELPQEQLTELLSLALLKLANYETKKQDLCSELRQNPNLKIRDSETIFEMIKPKAIDFYNPNESFYQKLKRNLED